MFNNSGLKKNIQMFRRAMRMIKKINPNNRWLMENSAERMDANRIDIFNEGRACFHRDRYVKAGEYVKDKIVLDAACGTGYGSQILKKFGAKEVVGLDLCSNAINYAKKYSESGVSFLSGDVSCLPFENNYFDIYVSFETIEHVDKELELLLEAKRVLKTGGLYIVSTPNNWGLGEKAPYHVRDYDYYLLLTRLSEFFMPVKLYNQNSGMMERFYNHKQERGFIETNESNLMLAECFFGVFKKV